MQGKLARLTAIFAAGVLLTVGPVASCAAAQSDGGAPAESSRERNKQIVDAAFGRWAAGGSDFFNEVVSPDVVWVIKGSGPSAGTFRSRDAFVVRAVRPFGARLSTPVRPVARRIWADGDHVIANWDGEGVARDGKPYRNSYVWILRMRDGKAVEVTAFLDLAPYDDVLRRVPAPTPAGG